MLSSAAVALGASIIEKHFTIDRSDKGPDSEFSIEPKELLELCNNSKQTWLALGKQGFKRDDIESSSKLHRRSIYFVKDLKAGRVIKKNDIRRIRPGLGLHPKYEEEIIGKTLKSDVEKGDPTCWDNFF